MEEAKICDYLWCKRAAVTASIDSLFWRDEDAPGNFWTIQEGSPFHNLLLFKKRHPQFKITITFAPRNMYGLERSPNITDLSLLDVRNAPDWVKQWILSVQKDFDWIEIASHGLTHFSGSGLEFDPYDNPYASDPLWCQKRVKEIRGLFAEIGLNDSEIIGFRGPGFRWTDPLIDALVEHDFLYVLVKGFFHLLFRSILRNIGRGRTFLETFKIHPFYYTTKEENKILLIPTTAHTDPSAYPDFKSYYFYIISRGGIINFFYHFKDDIYEQFDETLDFLESINDKLWWCTVGELAKYWIKKEGTRIERIRKQGKAWELKIRSDSSIYFPTSILLRINPNDILRITCNEKELTWTIVKDGAVITAILPKGTSTVLIELKSEPKIIKSNEKTEKKVAQEIFQAWMRQATHTRISNIVSLITPFLIELGFLLATEIAGLKLLDHNKYALIFIVAIGLGCWTALKSKILTTRLTATGYRPVRKYLIYLRNITPYPFKVTYPNVKYTLLALSIFVVLWLLLFLI